MATAKRKRKVLVIGRIRLKLPRAPKRIRRGGLDISRVLKGLGGLKGLPGSARKPAEGLAAAVRGRLSALMRRRVRLINLNIPIVFFFAAALVILPVGVVFGEDWQEPAGRNLADPAAPLVEIYNVGFYTGNPGDGEQEPLPGLSYPDGTKIENGDFWLSFDWRLLDASGAVAQGDYFDVSLDLGLAELPAEVAQQSGAFAPIIYMSDGTQAGTIKWLNQKSYAEQQRIVIRLELDASGFEGLTGDGTEEGRVAGTGIWGFRYEAGESAAGDRPVYWQISAGADGMPGGQISVDPEPPAGEEKPGGGNKAYNPYDEAEDGYEKLGTRLSPDDTPAADTIFYWNVLVNGHKHATYEEWKNCPNNLDELTHNDDPPLPADENGVFAETFTIIDTGKNTAPTWLRNVTEAAGKPVLHADEPLLVSRGAGLYGQGTGETEGPAWLKLYYVNSERIWEDRVDYEDSPYETPANDRDPAHKPADGHPVGAYDPYFTTWYMEEGEKSSVLYAPNGSEAGGKYEGYLTPVPTSDIRSIKLTQNGFEIEMVTEAVLGKTLSIAYMSKPATDADGNYHKDVGNNISIAGVNEGGPVAGASGEVLIGGTIHGTLLTSPNKGKFVIEKYDLNTAAPMKDVAFDIVASSEDKALETAVNAAIAAQKEKSPLPEKLLTGANGKLTLELPPLPWEGGKNLTLTVTETAPQSYVTMPPFTVTLEPENGTVISADAAQGSRKLVQIAPDQYGICVWNRSAEDDKSFYDAALRKWIKKVDRVIEGETFNVYYNEEPNTDLVSVKNGDRILYRVDLYNQCRNDIFITGITDWLPAGLRFDKDATVAHSEAGQAAYTNSVWEAVPGGEGQPDRVKYIGEPIHLYWWDGEGAYPEHRIPLILTVDVPEDAEDGTKLTNIAEISGLQNWEKETVEDADSTPDTDRDNDGAAPDVGYASEPAGAVSDNEIEEHRRDRDGLEDPAQDEDDHDYAAVKIDNPSVVSCEIDKDTIRRTSAAYVSLPDHEGFNNVGEEAYRYDIDFRSTSSLTADEFVVDDPLENVENGQVRLVTLWTPVVWGDEDGLYNLWYKTNLTKDGTRYDRDKATESGVTQKWPNEGYRLWQQDISATEREKLEVSKLGLAEGEYVTALRFEYGAVKVGFTSKNYSDVSLNGEQAQDAEALLALAGLKETEEPAAAGKAEDAEAEQAADTAEASRVTAAAAAAAAGSSESGETDAADTVDWTPDPARSDFAAGARDAQGLAPASYLVTAARAMNNENIVSSAVARISRQELWDEDVDAVLTREIVTFTYEDGEKKELVMQVSAADSIPKLEPDTEQAVRGAGASRTFDAMNPLLWFVLAGAAAGGLVLLRIRQKRGHAAARGRGAARGARR